MRPFPSRTASLFCLVCRPRLLIFLLTAFFLCGVSARVSANSVSGKVVLQGVAAGNMAQPLTFTLVPVISGSPLTYPLTPAADGSYTLTSVPAGIYKLLVKGSKWLQVATSVDATVGNATGVNVLLLGGDITGDNRVNIQDYNLFSAAYNTRPSDPNWNPNADFNCDGRVYIQDYSILSSNFAFFGATPQSAVAPSLRVEAGGSLYTDSTGNAWAEDDAAAPLATGGTVVTTTNTITGTNPGLYQTQREGASFSYTLPVPNGSYTLSLLFAEIDGNTAGQRTFNVVANGQQVLTNYDIYADSGGADTAVTKSFPVAVTNGQLTLTFTGVTDNAAIGAFSLVPLVPFGGDVPPPGWAEDVVPTDRSDTDGAGPSSSETVVLPSGVKENKPGPDLTVYNPVGPSVSFERTYRSSRAAKGYGSPGLSPGWVHNFDMTVQPNVPGAWGPLTLTYPNGAAETWTPVLSNGAPTGAFTLAAGTPYTVSGSPTATTGQWQTLTVTFKDHSRYVFAPSSGSADYYLWSQTINPAQRVVTINYDGSNRLLSAVNDAATSVSLLSCSYSGNYLSGITDAYGHQISYTFGSASDTNVAGSVLTAVSQIGSTNALWKYDYLSFNGLPFLNSVIVASPGDSGLSQPATSQFDVSGRVAKLVDANGNQRVYNYNSGATQVAVYDASNTLVQQWSQKFGALNADTGMIDAASHSSAMVYGDAGNPYKATQVQNKNGQYDQRGYDPYGDLTALTDLRSVQTTYTYDPNFPGQMTGVQTGSKTATNVTYYSNNTMVNGIVQPNGLVQSVSTPTPNHSGDGAQVMTTYVYTALGNLAAVTKPAPNQTSGAPVTTTYNYTSDPGDGVHGIASYSQNEALGQPLTVTDPLGHVTHMRWNAQGQLSALIDALGHETDYFYYIYDNQLQNVIFPATGQTGSGQSHMVYSYWHTGGPLEAITVYDEGGNIVREVTFGNGPEGEAQSDTGDLLPLAYAFDPRYRLDHLTDGNSRPAQKYGYDALDNLTSLTYPLGDGVTFPQYDNDNNLLQRQDGRSITTTYTRATDDSRVTGIGYSDGTPGITYQHDQYDRVTQMTDGAGTTTYGYDDDDNLLSVTTSYTNGPQNQVISYAYNSDGSRATMTTPKGTFSYTYDNAGRMTNVSAPWTGGGYSYTYDDADRLTKQHFSKADTTYAYNARGFLTSLLNASTYPGYGTMSYFYNLGYDALGNRKNIAATIPKITYIDGTNHSYAPDASRGLLYGYDSADQIAAEYSNPTFNTAYNDTYNWGFGTDGAGNLTTLRGVSIGYDADDRLSGQTYDGDGNPTTYQGYTFHYDAEDRITNINSVMTAGYTGDGQRAWKGDANGNNRTYFLYDGDKVVCEENSAGTLINTYGYGPAGLVQRYIQSIPGYIGYTFDPQGTVVQRHRQVDNFVVSADTAVYDGFGVLDADVDGQNGGAYTSTDSVGFLGQSGHYTDPETRPLAPGGMVSVGGTYYDVRLGRYVTRGGDVNGYKALDNNPASYVDWLGVAQTTADTVGLIPVLNVPTSIFSAGVSAYRGDYAGAGLSLIAVIPFAGEEADAVKIARDAKSLDKGITEAAAFHSQSDPLTEVFGAAHTSHPDEHAAVLKHLDEAGVDVAFRPGENFYTPGLKPGEPGQIRLDPEGSIGALRHEYQHFLDDEAAGRPGIGHYMDGNGEARWRLERRAYMVELAIARQAGNRSVRRQLIENALREKRSIFGR